MNHLNKKVYIFDVDGTLTEPRKRMSKKFANFFSSWSKDKTLIISTGSDYQKTRQQIPLEILKKFQYIFCCMGNELRNSKGKIIRSNNFVPESSLIEDLKNIVKRSKYKEKTGLHIENRTGMLNFSVVGRNADSQQRKKYNLWDEKNKERLNIVNKLSKKYTDLNFSIGGSISIDIIPVGNDKGQCIDYIIENLNPDNIEFYGDKTSPGGNDYGIVKKIESLNINSLSWTCVNGPDDLERILLLKDK